jgi:HAD superfamily hydrolase (TIGR01484 family)
MYFVALATDYDGTLAHDGLVLDATISALEEVKKTGRKIVLVTGREMKDVKEVFPRYEIFDRIVAENGAVTYTPATQEEKVIAPPPPAEFVERLRALKVEPLSVGRSIVATWEPNEATILDVIRDIGLELHIVFNKGAVMVLPANVNKASGLAAALEEMGISPLNTIAIGDAENDHAFLTASGCAVAVANALDSVKATADLVTKAERGDGVQEVLATLVAGREGDLIRAARRHAVVFASDESGEEISLYPSRGSILISGRSGAGKSTLSTALLERMMMRGFQTCIIDPEGDYSELEGATVIGSADAPPRMEEIFDLLADPATNVVVNLLGVEVDRRPEFFAKLVPELSSLRVASGRPHWVLIDEAHHMFPASRESVPMTLPKELPSAILVTVHPASVAPAALELIDTVIGVGEGAPDVIAEACKAMGDACPPLPEGWTDPKQALMWARRPEATMRRIIVEQTRQAHRRHTRKYAQGNLGEDKSFYFRGPEDALNLRAQNLMLFVQIGNGVDEQTWLHHLRAGDYSDWFRNAIKDEELANEASEVEADASLSAEDSRARIMASVTRRYTAPAAGDGDTIE